MPASLIRTSIPGTRTRTWTPRRWTDPSTRPPISSAEPAPSGVAVIDKPAGWTSHQVVGRVRRLAGTRRVGHAGTLDPMATGVLVVGVNRATRLLGLLALTDKAYAATIRLGVTTITDDAEGEVVQRTAVRELPDDLIEAALRPLRGDILQVPTAVSAIKVNGVRSYAKVRAGQSVQHAARPVSVKRLEVLARRDSAGDGLPVVDLDVAVECSSGTYVRALARDLGSTLGVGGHLTALRRTQVGPYGLDSAQTLADAATAGLMIEPLDDVARRTFATLNLSADQAEHVKHGRRLAGQALPGAPAALFGPDGDFLALYRAEGPDAVAVAVFID